MLQNMASLTDEQRRRIEENKRKALAIRAAKQSPGPNSHIFSGPAVGVSTSSKTYTGSSSNPYSSNSHSPALNSSSPASKPSSPFAISNAFSTSSNQPSNNHPISGSASSNLDGRNTRTLPVTFFDTNSSKSNLNNNKSVSENTPLNGIFYGNSPAAASVTVSFSLLSSIRFIIDFPFNDIIVKVLKTIPGKLYGENFAICPRQCFILSHILIVSIF